MSEACTAPEPLPPTFSGSTHCPLSFLSTVPSLASSLLNPLYPLGQHTDVSPTCSAAWLSALSSARLLGRTVPTPRLCCTSSPVPLFGVLPGPHSSRTAPSELRVPEPHVYSPSPSHLLSPHSEPMNCPWLLLPSCQPFVFLLQLWPSLRISALSFLPRF